MGFRGSVRKVGGNYPELYEVRTKMNRVPFVLEEAFESPFEVVAHKGDRVLVRGIPRQEGRGALDQQGQVRQGKEIERTAAVSVFCPPPDPGQAQTIEEFVDVMVELRIWSGLSLRKVSVASGGAIAHSTLGDILKRRDRLPDPKKQLRPFVSACGLPLAEVDRWEARCRALAVRAAQEQKVSSERWFRRLWNVSKRGTRSKTS